MLVDLVALATLVLAVLVAAVWIVTAFLVGEDRGYERGQRDADVLRFFVD